MPEHRTETPERLAGLESFLWHDFDAGPDDWRRWLRRKLPDVGDEAARGSFDDAMRLHRALRGLQAAESPEASRESFDRLVASCVIRPSLARDGRLAFVAPDPEGPMARILIWALDAMQAGQWRRFKLCRDPSCRASFYDASKAAAKNWCAMQTCGSRNKMRRYRARSAQNRIDRDNA